MSRVRFAQVMAAVMISAIVANSRGGSLSIQRGLSSAAMPARYRVLDLGTLGGSWAWVADINESGQVVGWSADAHGRKRAYRTAAGRAIRAADELAIPRFAGMPGTPESSQAMGISNDGTAFGFTLDERDGEWPYVWLPDGRAVDGGPGSGKLLRAHGTGHAVGYKYRFLPGTGTMVRTAFLRRPDGSTASLERLDGGSTGIGVDSRGRVVGGGSISRTADQHAIFWYGSDFLDIGERLGTGHSTATCINSLRWTADKGRGADTISYTGARAGTPIPLPRLVDAPYSITRDLTELDTLVGSSRTTNGIRPTIWHIGPTSTEVVDLSTRIAGFSGVVQDAMAINEEGQIAVGTVVGRESRAAVLIPERLVLTAPSRPRSGTAAEYRVTGCMPGAKVRLYRGAPGPGPRYRAMAVKWDITAPDVFGPEATADSTGTARFRVNTPVSLKSIYLQAIHRGNKSNVASVTPQVLPAGSLTPSTPLTPLKRP